MNAVEEFEFEPFTARQSKYKACLDELVALNLGPKSMVTDAMTLRKFYSKDKSSHARSVPVAAVRPNSTEQVAAVVQVCAKYKVPMTPRGAGTGIEGACIPYAGGIVIDTDRLTRMDFDLDNSCVWVGAGVRKMTLNKAAAKHGFVFGPDPSSNPCVGGMVATSGSGMCTLRYGTTRENVLSLRVVTPQGTVVQTRQVVRKSSAGLELTQLYIGSEGTLGVICEVCFRLFPIQKCSSGGVGFFATTRAAVRAVVALKQQGVPHTLLRCELLNKESVAAANSYNKTNLRVSACVLLEFVCDSAGQRHIHGDYKKVAAVFKKFGAKEVRYLKDGKAMDAVWEARRSCFFSAMHAIKTKGAQSVITTDVCVPISRLAECVEATEEDFKQNSRPCLICAHISDGNFHTLVPYTDAADFKRARELEIRMVRRAVEMGGTVSGEHGVGIGKVRHVTQEHGKAHICVQETIKKALDPDNIMNPGCFYPFQQVMYPTAHL
ncbi:D-lactate dehydrogenase-like protein [Leishmania major strain Friedlin]|uniref:D-lactate dehydrogenase (cytochrome) n=1 Tax=Leishmania major TaxID=5664 RepID=E9ADN0_LEIMA|nr:D-lactate dehydrogenase-like protein [Leishmania major strain Friedlin]CAG9577756.1 D-lactate_dehydrogenase-like_protein [Leishmania major strain Friedlin]CBZ12359.1 D-lactate dehydrogenase-like protein [Leishmania major strain Friedlin]|eukprot:XP_003722102.1 D-lactate dehydrogenase-like protein [Leishmania major strain Friedlin]